MSYVIVKVKLINRYKPSSRTVHQLTNIDEVPREKHMRSDFTLISSYMLAGSHVVRLLRIIRISRLVCPGMCLRTETNSN